MKHKPIFIMVILMLLMCTMAYGKELPHIDIRYVSQGIVRISYQSDKKIKVIVKNNDKQYTYNLTADGRVETFPLQLGSGQYTVGVYENTTESKYKKLTSKTFQLGDINEQIVYLNAVQNVNWNEEDEAIKLAKVLTRDKKTNMEKAISIYTYIVSNFNYDEDKIQKLAYNYIPEVDSILKTKSGICYDFSTLYGAMLRSTGVPTKLVTGYSLNAIGYHSWNEIYDENTNEWLIVDLTYDVQLNQLIHEREMKKNKILYKKEKEY
nr:transglutaminase-like domain-containing protein [uncultured Cellulosilyticum sp.]